MEIRLWCEDFGNAPPHASMPCFSSWWQKLSLPRLLFLIFPNVLETSFIPSSSRDYTSLPHARGPLSIMSIMLGRSTSSRFSALALPLKLLRSRSSILPYPLMAHIMNCSFTLLPTLLPNILRPWIALTFHTYNEEVASLSSHSSNNNHPVYHIFSPDRYP